MSFIGKIHVESPGLFTTIQDRGRFGYRRYGVPRSGVMDDYAARLANFLAGNEMLAPLLEISFTGPRLFFQHATQIVITGADMSPKINGRKVEMYKCISIKTGDLLSYGKLKSGCRTYLAISGGFIGDYDLESCSTYVPAKFGGHHGRQLEKGDPLFFNLSRFPIAKRMLPEHFIPNYDAPRRIRILKGPEWAVIEGDLEKAFAGKTFLIGKNSDRMGTRLQSLLLEYYESKEMLSSALAKGSIQLIPNGELIIAMSDGQTTGGYPRIASIITVDIPYVAQLKPGDRISFVLIEKTAAKALLLHREAKLKFI